MAKERDTDEIDPRDVRVSWPVALATLDQLGDWHAYALRLGTLALIQECVRDAAQRNAGSEVVGRFRELVEALARMHWYQPDDSDRGAS